MLTLCAATTKDFQNFCNSFDSGYLKEHKAYGILDQINDLPVILQDRPRLLKYLSNCLEMEGFRSDDIPAIADWLIAQ